MIRFNESVSSPTPLKDPNRVTCFAANNCFVTNGTFSCKFSVLLANKVISLHLLG